MSWLNRNLIIECLRELSSRSLQEELWTSKGVTDVSSFSEVVEQLFTDSGLDDALNAKATGFSDDVESKLCGLEKRLAKVHGRGDPMATINDPEMLRVRDLASEILSMIEGSEMRSQ